MGVMDKLNGIFNIDSEDDGFYDDGDDEYMDDPEPGYRKPTVVKDSDDHSGEATSVRRPRTIPPKSRKSNGNGMEVCVVKPTTFEEAREITDILLSNRTVVLNLEGLNVDIAQRIIDFASGSCYAMSGNLQKISNYIFIITPPSVDISGTFQDLITGTLDVEISR